MIQHIVFDIGRVLIEWDPERPYRRLIPDAARRAWFLSTVCTPDWNREQDRGRTWQEAEAALIETWPQEAELIRAYRANWLEMVPATIAGTPDILTALVAAGRDVTMLTNFSSETFALATERFPILTMARGVTVSGEIETSGTAAHGIFAQAIAAGGGYLTASNGSLVIGTSAVSTEAS